MNQALQELLGKNALITQRNENMVLRRNKSRRRKKRVEDLEGRSALITEKKGNTR